jgi:tetrahydromethanopterin S-methyltransferase subunit F
VARVVVMGSERPRRKQLSKRQAKLWTAANRRSYLGLFIGALLALLILFIALSTD